MEQNYRQSGYKQLNRMNLWNNVLHAKKRLRPNCLVYCNDYVMAEALLEIVSGEWKSQPRFIIVYVDLEYTPMTPLMDVLYTTPELRNELPEKQRWQDIDIALIPHDDYLAISAQLGGVAVYHTMQDFLKAIDKGWRFSRNTRVDNFEQASKVLDNYDFML